VVTAVVDMSSQNLKGPSLVGNFVFFMAPAMNRCADDCTRVVVERELGGEMRGIYGVCGESSSLRGGSYSRYLA